MATRSRPSHLSLLLLGSPLLAAPLAGTLPVAAGTAPAKAAAGSGAPAAKGVAPGAAIPAAGVPLQPCAAPQPGRYVLMSQGNLPAGPYAALLQETWSADGQIRGVRLQRTGHEFSEAPYTGRFEPISLCRVRIQRTFANTLRQSQAVLDLNGIPRYSIGLLPDVFSISRWFRQPNTACTASLLNGAAVSQQEGANYRQGAWRRNGTVQHERWNNGTVRGIAISSYGETVEEATYQGTLKVGPDCLATIHQRDSLDVDWNYRGIVLADGSGYLYLQTDRDDLNVGYIEHLRP
ncbi:MAG: hypothetical protein NTZ40_07320 [Cyanobacteria bacterium]|nr:hypothetical protein [Cyanobacteriota bacterium]